MMSMDTSLNALRREIDAIDDQLHDLIMRRTGVVEKVRDVKKGQKMKIRPAREAEILIRLLARHHGPFPKRELIRIWRELIIATLSFEGPFSAAVFVPEDDPGYWDLARDQYGAFTSISRQASPRRIIEIVHAGEATLGILPLPTQPDPDPWWPLLVASGAPKIIARLPVVGPGNGPTGPLEALVICPVKLEPSGRDVSYLVIEMEEQISRDFLATRMENAGLPARFIGTWRDGEVTAGWLYLIEVEGFIIGEGPETKALADSIKARISRIIFLGVSTAPFSAQELETDVGNKTPDTRP